MNHLRHRNEKEHHTSHHQKRQDLEAASTPAPPLAQNTSGHLKSLLGQLDSRSPRREQGVRRAERAQSATSLTRQADRARRRSAPPSLALPQSFRTTVRLRAFHGQEQSAVFRHYVARQ